MTTIKETQEFVITQEMKNKIIAEHRKDYLSKNWEKIKQRRRERYAEDDEYREKIKEYQRARPKSKRYAEDDEYRNKLRAKQREYYHMKKLNKLLLKESEIFEKK